MATPTPRARGRRRAGASLLALLLAAACAPSGTPRDDGTTTTGGLRIEGTLTGEGVECQAMRSRDGELYTLTGDLGGYGAGDEVWVEGSVAEISFCMQGTTLVVERIGALGDGE